MVKSLASNYILFEIICFKFFKVLFFAILIYSEDSNYSGCIDEVFIYRLIRFVSFYINLYQFNYSYGTSGSLYYSTNM